MLAMFLVAGDQGLPLRLESEMLDLRFRLRPPRPHRVPVVIVEIDDASIADCQTACNRDPGSARKRDPSPTLGQACPGSE
jgi:CHASE2 domain-containing sensor protein